MRPYTVGVAGETVTLIPSGSGGSTPSGRIYGRVAELVKQLPAKE